MDRQHFQCGIELSTGLVQGIAIDGMLGAANTCNEVTRASCFKDNLICIAELAWFRAGDEKGNRICLAFLTATDWSFSLTTYSS